MLTPPVKEPDNLFRDVQVKPAGYLLCNFLWFFFIFTLNVIFFLLNVFASDFSFVIAALP